MNDERFGTLGVIEGRKGRKEGKEKMMNTLACGMGMCLSVLSICPYF